MVSSCITISLVEQARGGPFVYWDDLAESCRAAHDLGFDADGVAGVEFAAQQGFGERVFHALLDDAAQRAGAEDGVIALFAEPILRIVGELDCYATDGQAPSDLHKLQFDNPADVRLRQGMEDHGVVDAVEELGGL